MLAAETFCKKPYFTLAIEPCRLWPLFMVDCYRNDSFFAFNSLFADPVDVKVEYEKEDVRIRIPLAIFDGFRRPGSPMRMNIWSSDGSFFWVEPQFLPESRLQFRKIIPDNFGWINLK